MERGGEARVLGVEKDAVSFVFDDFPNSPCVDSDRRDARRHGFHWTRPWVSDFEAQGRHRRPRRHRRGVCLRRGRRRTDGW